MRALPSQRWDGHKIASIGLFAVYLTVASAVDLFHNETCYLGLEEPGASDGVCDAEPCPACMFNAGANSSEPSYQTTLITAELPALASQTPPDFVVLSSEDWANSVVPRGPPQTIIS